MRNICPLSRRWHQQFSLSASFTSHRQCLQHLQAQPQVRLLRQAAKPKRARTATSSRTPSLVVRQFEQYGNDPTTRREEHPDEGPIGEETAMVKAQIDKLEAEMDALRRNPSAIDNEFIMSLPPEERAIASQQIKAAGIKGTEFDDEMFHEDELDSMLAEADRSEADRKSFGVTLRIPQRDKVYVRHFNKALQEVEAANDDPNKNLVLWKWYVRCQEKVPNFLRVMPDSVLDSLWKSQCGNYYQSKHIVVLAEHILNEKRDLDPWKQLQYIEALQVDGNLSTAIKVWEESQSIGSGETSLTPQYLEIGVKLHAQLGRISKAQKIALQGIQEGKVRDVRLLLDIMTGWSKSPSPNAIENAWSCYLTLRSQLGDAIKAEDFDKASNIFLKAGKKDMATAIFVDLVAWKRGIKGDSAERFTKALAQIGTAGSEIVQEADVNRVGLTILQSWPKQFHNKYFFGSWIKSLIGQQDLESAAQVVELMYENGIVPDAKYLNGLIGAWFRTGSKASHRRAEVLARAMIESRVKMVQERKQEENDRIEATSATAKVTPSQIFQASRKYVISQRPAPAATIETFSILLLYYTRRSEFTKASDLTDLMTGPAGMKPNAFIMNHWLFASLRRGDVDGVWNKYNDLKHDIKPDLETFTALWDAGKANYSELPGKQSTQFPSARLLFAEMTRWAQQLLAGNNKSSNTALVLNKVKEEFSAEFYEQIIRCFCLSFDIRGAFCAIHGLKTLFNVFPTANAAQIILMQVARMVPSSDTSSSSSTTGTVGVGGRTSRFRRTGRPSNYASSLRELTQVIEDLSQLKADEMLDHCHKNAETLERDLADPDSRSSQELRLNVLSEFVLMFAGQRLHPKGDLRNEIHQVAGVMGVELGDDILGKNEATGGGGDGVD